MRTSLWWACVAVGVLGAGELPAAEPLPPPRPVGPVVVMVYPAPAYRPDPYAHWQAYGVTNTGRFRPLVVARPWGGYYYATGQPYPWVTTQPGLFRPSWSATGPASLRPAGLD